MSTSIAHSDPNHQHDLARSNAAHFDAFVHEHAHSHHVKHVAEKIAEKIVQLLGIRSQDEQAQDDDHNDHHDDHDRPSEGITVLDYACGAGQSPYHPITPHLSPALSYRFRFLKLIHLSRRDDMGSLRQARWQMEAVCWRRHQPKIRRPLQSKGRHSIYTRGDPSSLYRTQRSPWRTQRKDI